MDFFSPFLLISRESHRGWSPETTREGKVGHCRFIVVMPADVVQAGFNSLTIELTVHRGLGKLVSKLEEEDLAGCDPTPFGKCIKVFFGGETCYGPLQAWEWIVL